MKFGMSIGLRLCAAVCGFAELYQGESKCILQGDFGWGRSQERGRINSRAQNHPSHLVTGISKSEVQAVGDITKNFLSGELVTLYAILGQISLIFTLVSTGIEPLILSTEITVVGYSTSLFD